MESFTDNSQLQFVSKLYTKGKASLPIVRKITFLLVALYSLTVLATYLLNGFSLAFVLKHIITYLLCFFVLQLTKPINGYQSAIAVVDIDESKFSVKYGNPDDEAAYIPATANVKIYFRNIVDIKYDRFSQELFIKECSRETNEEAFTIIYIPEEESKILMTHILSRCNFTEKEELKEYV